MDLNLCCFGTLWKCCARCDYSILAAYVQNVSNRHLSCNSGCGCVRPEYSGNEYRPGDLQFMQTFSSQLAWLHVGFHVRHVTRQEMFPKMPFITHKGDKEIPKGHAKWIAPTCFIILCHSLLPFLMPLACC